jgi:hypothetical protein
MISSLFLSNRHIHIPNFYFPHCVLRIEIDSHDLYSYTHCISVYGHSMSFSNNLLIYNPPFDRNYKSINILLFEIFF